MLDWGLSRKCQNRTFTIAPRVDPEAPKLASQLPWPVRGVYKARENREWELIRARNRGERAIFHGPRPMYATASDFRYGPFRLDSGPEKDPTRGFPRPYTPKGNGQAAPGPCHWPGRARGGAAVFWGDIGHSPGSHLYKGISSRHFNP